jgi:DNA polymerase I
MNPGAEEISHKKPFVGPSGKLLKQALEKSGLNDLEPFITNACLCLPPKDVALQKFAIDNCRARVFEELRQVQPKIILAFGNVALQSLMNSTKYKIGNCHSKPMEHELGLIIPIYHPAAILRNVKDYKTFLNGFLYARKLLNGESEKNPGKTEYRIINSFNTEQFKTDMDSLLNYNGVISCDIETTSLDPRKAKILVVAFGLVKNLVYVFPPEELNALKFIMENTKAKICYQRGQYDTSVLSYNDIETEVHHDTLLQHYTLNENEGGHDLKTLARLFLGATEYDKDIDKSKMAELPKEELYQYVAHDADYTLQLHNLFLPQIEEDTNLYNVYYNILIPGINFLRRTSQRGIQVDRGYLQEFKVLTQSQIDELKLEVTNAFGKLWNRERYLKETEAKSAPKEFNPNSPPQMAWIIYDRLKIIPNVKKKVQRSSDKEIIESIKDKHNGFEALLAYKAKTKIMSTYIKGIEKKIDTDGRLRSNFNLQTTVTGRLSSSKPNLQNISRNKDVKNIFIAPKHRILIEADYSQLELRLLAHFSDDDFLLDTFLQGRDLHSEMAKEIYGKDFTKEDRTKVKSLNFGIAYGISAFALSQDLHISVSEAQMMIDKWYERSPKAREYLEGCEKQLMDGEIFITPFGRERRYGIITDEKGQKNEARNFKIQSTGSDLNLLSAIELENPLLLLDAFSVNLIHDAILTEAPNDDIKARKIIASKKEIMEYTPVKYLHPKIPFTVDIEYGFKWGEMIDYKI